MSLLTAFNSIVQSFEDIQGDLGVSSVEIGIPVDPFNRAPALYVEPSTEDRERSGLRRTITTSTVASVVAVYVFPKSQVVVSSPPSEEEPPEEPSEEPPPSQEDLLKWMLDRAHFIIQKIDEDNDSGVYLADGDRGFAAYVTQTEFYYRPDDVVAGIRIVIRLEAYH